METKWVFDKIIQFLENNAFKRTSGGDDVYNDDDFDPDYDNDDNHDDCDCEYDDDDEGLEISIS